MNSGRAINYSTRLAKNVERKMIRDGLVRLFTFAHTNEYQYIGFGSKYFTDFILFHKYLHINKMTSIESDSSGRKKYEFNKPFNCIQIRFGTSHEELPRLDLSQKTILWLDYDGLLKTECLVDISTFFEKASSGSVLIVSYNSRPLKQFELEREFPDCETSKLSETKLKQDINPKYIPHGTEYRGTANWETYSKLLRSIVITSIKSAISLRNRGRNQGDNELMMFEQIFNFNYQDGVEMSTLGFVIYNKFDQSKFDSSKFGDLDFYKNGDDAFTVCVPNLTQKEFKYLTERMPAIEGKIPRAEIESGIFIDKEIAEFSKIYKYIPNFQDAEFS